MLVWVFADEKYDIKTKYNDWMLQKRVCIYYGDWIQDKSALRVFISCAVPSICGRWETGGAEFGVGVKETVKVNL